MRPALPLPFAPALDALMSRLVARYTGGRASLRADEVGELAWGVSTLWEGFTGKRELPGWAASAVGPEALFPAQLRSVRKNRLRRRFGGH